MPSNFPDPTVWGSTSENVRENSWLLFTYAPRQKNKLSLVGLSRGGDRTWGAPANYRIRLGIGGNGHRLGFGARLGRSPETPRYGIATPGGFSIRHSDRSSVPEETE